MMNRRLIPFVGILALPVLTAHAGFVGGRETFDGTSKDAATWEEFNQNSTISQSDRLTINADGVDQFDSGDYTTKTYTVPVGGRVQADVTIDSLLASAPPKGYAREAMLALTNNSFGTTAATPVDSYEFSVLIDFTPASGFSDFETDASANGSGGGQRINGLTPVLGQAYRLSLTRIDSTHVNYGVSNLDGSGAVSITSSVTANTAPLFISLVGINVQADFDNVSTPEPGTIAISSLALAELWKRRR